MENRSRDHEVCRYGAHSDQILTLARSAAEPSRGTTVLVHGGYWRERITADVMSPILEKLLESGWNVANVEYRRGPSNPWPIPCTDVATAIRWVRTQDLGGPLVLLGHSVGGQLALLNAHEADAVVALAPVTDVVKVHDEDLGDSAAQEYFGFAPEEDHAIYAAASPIAQSDVGLPLLVVHGANDDRVPLEHTRRYLSLRDSGHQAHTIFPEQLDHFQVIDPRQPHWEVVADWMGALSERLPEAPISR